MGRVVVVTFDENEEEKLNELLHFLSAKKYSEMPDKQNRVLDYGALKINAEYRSVESNGELVQLTNYEFEILYLLAINYGNQNTGTNLNLYWTDFSLKISPIEQVELLQDFYQNNFHFDSKNIQAVKKALLLSTTSSGSLYGKTGTGRVNGKDVNGWFIGYIETSNNTYYFATNIQSSSGATGSQATEITKSVLSNLGIWK